MNIFIEGPDWTGKWTEIIADCLQQAGHRVGISYHNRKRLRDRISLARQSWLPGHDRKAAWARRHRQQLVENMSHATWDALLSIQGPLDEHTVALCRQRSPDLKIYYWWGDILTEQGKARIDTAAGFSERILLSGKGNFDSLFPRYREQLLYFPFAASERFHSVNNLSTAERKRFSARVAFVGTCYPERCALIRYLNEQLDSPVTVWGRGWHHCKGVRSRGALSLADSLKVHACSRISLNLHHAETNNGFNMKFYEIPAAGGFQVCDWQPLLETTELGKHTVACKSLPEFAEKIQYYLAQEPQRRQRAETNRELVLSTGNYATRLAALFPPAA